MVLEFVAAAPPISYALHFEPRTKEKKKKQQQQQWEVTKQTQKCAAIVVIFGDCSCTRARAATLVCVFSLILFPVCVAPLHTRRTLPRTVRCYTHIVVVIHYGLFSSAVVFLCAEFSLKIFVFFSETCHRPHISLHFTQFQGTNICILSFAHRNAFLRCTVAFMWLGCVWVFWEGNSDA